MLPALVRWIMSETADLYVGMDVHKATVSIAVADSFAFPKFSYLGFIHESRRCLCGFRLLSKRNLLLMLQNQNPFG